MFVWTYVDFCSFDGDAYMSAPVVFKCHKDAKAYMTKKINELYEHTVEREEVDSEIDKGDFYRIATDYYKNHFTFMIKKSKVKGL